MTDKKCSRCGEWKLFEEFHKDKTKKDGRDYRCKVCYKEHDRQRYEANPDKKKELVKKYREANLEKIREKDRNYRKNNIEKFREYDSKYREANPRKYKAYSEKHKERTYKWRKANSEKWKEYKRKCYKANPERHREYSRQYYKANTDKYRASYAKYRGLKVSTSTTDPWELAEITLFYAACPEGYHVDHIVPLNIGGRHELSNLQYLEAWLNLSKHDKHPDDWDDPRPISCRG